MKALLPLALLAGFLAMPLAAASLQDGSGVVQEDKKEKKKPKPYELGSTVDAKLSLKDIEGKTHTFGDLRGKVVFVHFHSTTCPYMGPAEPKIMKMVEDYAKKDVVILGINANQREIGAPPKEKGAMAEPYEALKKHVKKNKVNFPILPDHGARVADMFQARTTPHCYVIDKKGVIQYVGALDDDPRGKKEKVTNHVADAIDALLGGKKVKTSSTKPYG